MSSFFGAEHDTKKTSVIMESNFVFILQNYKEIFFMLKKNVPLQTFKINH